MKKPRTFSEGLFYTTARIDTINEDGEGGSGTGFFYEGMAGSHYFSCIVSNKHVVLRDPGNKRVVKNRITFLKKDADDQPILGKGVSVDIDDPQDSWFGHPDDFIDIAILPLRGTMAYMREDLKTEIYAIAVNKDPFTVSKDHGELDAIEDVTFIGYPSGLWDRANRLPISRQGMTATPIAIDYEEKPIFLIDASIFGGSSGSPVFVIHKAMHPLKTGGFSGEPRCYFVGVVSAGLEHPILGGDAPAPATAQAARKAGQGEKIDIGIVFKERTVVDTINAYVQINPPPESE